MHIPLRRLIVILVLVLVLTVNCAQAKDAPEVLYLWSGSPPNGPGPQGDELVTDKGSVTNVSRPRLVVHRPQHPNGTAALVISGGGYAHIEQGKESTPASTWLQSMGVTAFELVYRLPREGWSDRTVPFQDAQRAMRLIRSHASQFGIAPDRIGVVGFSAGGHLAGMIATEPEQKRYPTVDAADSVSARPDFVALIYPVLTMLPPFDKTHARREILGRSPGQEQQIAYSVEQHVSGNTPKTFLAQAVDDRTSVIDNSLLMFDVLRKAEVPSELHIFQTGGHGWGMGAPGSEVSEWSRLFWTWLTSNPS